ncbi:MAG TPA: hypothetical protein PLJ47_06875 [Candidatus Hydrogenedentes bacterium]|nr:hypothetical protein [Candidatus Hydrogenedentota bacterium]HRK34302.1 hypothetical protein [Candidatus Hydrogenedentota bacterium]
MSLIEIKMAIESLTERERSELNAWLQNYASDEWDRQMESDAHSERLQSLAREAEKAYRDGECDSFP